MADLGQDFDPDGHEHVSFGPVPVGEYELIVVKSDVKRTNAGDGSYASFDMQIVSEGEYQNRHVFQNITVENKSEQAVDIGRRQLADLCRACGKGAIRDTAELHDIPFFAKVGIEKGKNNYPDKNKINEFMPAGGVAPATVAAPKAAAPPTTARPQSVTTQRTTTAPARKPWERKTA